ncbi:ribosome-binding protein 1b isoform X2 [Micropterus dolomieu]|uniref:ribosome-binding protein 1b isoform X2 n=1 Tax=Micropterus dolomieu TaxID=147949 RepID=UPI001E8E0860|nr:ribosome-binding protein 1b isoform X2 [Micropterus dolomieu]
MRSRAAAWGRSFWSRSEKVPRLCSLTDSAETSCSTLGSVMDVSDPQTLGFMVFGSFMIISAVGIALVSTLSMKETSYEEALAKQRRQLVHTHSQRAEKKKKDKTLEKKNKAKRKEDRPDGKLSELSGDGGEDSEVVESDPEPAAEPAAAPEPKPAPEPEPEPTMVTTATAIESAPAPSPKETKKKKSAKEEPAAGVETVAKEVLVTAVAPVVDVSSVNVVPEVTKEQSATKTEEPKETLSKKKKSKNKPEPVSNSADSSRPLTYGELLSAVSNMTLSEDEIHKLMKVLNQKAGVRQDSWQLASQKGDPLSALKKQLEEKEKLLTTMQEDAAAAKSRLRELSKELGAEKSKMASSEASLKAELRSRVQEVEALRARMQTADQEHLKQTQQLNQKIGSLQEQLENGPNAQLARLQQENSILRDALNQATSQAESRQNAELARLRQDCVRLGRELTERTDALRADEERRKSLEAKMAAAQQELARAQLVHADTERALQRRLEEVCSELKMSQQEAAAVSELQGALVSREAELQEIKVQLENQAAVQADGSSDVEQLKICVQRRDEQVVALEAELTQLREELQLLTSSQSQRATEEEAAGDPTQKDVSLTAADWSSSPLQGSGSETESEQPFESLEEDSQLLRLEEELQQARNHADELREKMAASAVAFSAAEHLSEQREAELKAALAEAESSFVSLRLDFQASLQVLFPGISVEAEQKNWLQLFTQRVQEGKGEAERAHSELQSRLKEAERLQAEFDQNRKLLQETKAELQALRQRCEEEQTIWKNKQSEAEQQKQMILDQLKLLEEEVQRKRTETEDTQQLKEQLMLVEAQLEKQLEEATFSQSCSEELAQVQSRLQQTSARLQSEQQQRQQLDRELQQARQEVLALRAEADQRSAAPLKEAAPVEVKEETPV